MVVQGNALQLRALARLHRHIAEHHALRQTINAGLSVIHEENLFQALTQKKHLKKLKESYELLTQEVACLPPLDQAAVLKPEFDYITTIENILTTTQELRRGADIGKENEEALREGLVKFYDGLRAEIAAVGVEK